MTCFSFFRGRRSKASPKRSSELDDAGLNVTIYSYKELSMATNDFSPINKIGEGGFGSVYKGKLKNDKMAAIKVLSAGSKQGVREFLTEIQVISDTQHENLVELYGCCVEGNHRILVYNYLENNSLAQTLIGGHRSGIQFSWQTRVRICVGVAKGLAYLNDELRPPIVHRDIKASNILLDKDLSPKISDFGLAKLIPENMTHVSTRVAGTLGYLAPEYAMKGQLTRKADIYSFGVLLIEIISGRCNTNSLLPAEEKYILERAWLLHEKRELVQLVDPMLNGDFDPEQACRFLKIGLLCAQEFPKLRPSMTSVARMLAGEKDFDENKITRPGIITDLMDLNVRNTPKAMPEMNMNKTSSNFLSSGSDNLETSTLSSGTSQATFTFTAVYDRSV